MKRKTMTQRQAEMYGAHHRPLREPRVPAHLSRPDGSGKLASPNGVYVHLRALAARGLIVLEQGSARGIVVPPLRDAMRQIATQMLSQTRYDA